MLVPARDADLSAAVKADNERGSTHPAHSAPFAIASPHLQRYIADPLKSGLPAVIAFNVNANSNMLIHGTPPKRSLDPGVAIAFPRRCMRLGNPLSLSTQR
jgi:hypothetical protein